MVAFPFRPETCGGRWPSFYWSTKKPPSVLLHLPTCPLFRLSSQVSKPAGLCGGCLNITVEQIYFWKQKNDLCLKHEKFNWFFLNSRKYGFKKSKERALMQLEILLPVGSIFLNRNPQKWLFSSMSHNHMSYSHINEVKNVLFSPLRTLIARLWCTLKF